MTARERAESIVYDIGGVTRMCPSIYDPHVALVEKELLASEREGYRKGVEDLLAGVLREQQYHEFLEDKGEMRHPILACKEIASYARALLAKGEG